MEKDYVLGWLLAALGSSELGWLEEPAAVLPSASLHGAPIPSGAELVAPVGIRYWGSDVPLEMIRFAGSNRLLVEFEYDGKHRVVEPYSLRTARTTCNLLLYGWEEGATRIKAFNVAKVSDVSVSGGTFTPRYKVEFTTTGSVSAPKCVEGPS